MKEPLSRTHPEIAAQWHPTKNGDRTPDNVVAGSGKKVWWQCSKGPDHEWQARPTDRTVKGSRCPFCSGHKASITNSLASVFPDIAAEWHPEKNGEQTPDKVLPRSNTRVWWMCLLGPDHEWLATPNDRTHSSRPTKCPFCEGHRLSLKNSLAALFPDIAAQWHPQKNGEQTPEKVVAGSHKCFWWKCLNGPDHEWQATVDSRTSKRGATGCPYCVGKRVSVSNSLTSLFPEVAAEWHPTKNRDLSPDRVVAGANRSFWWKCPKGPDHEWKSVLNSRTYGGAGCPFCRGFKASPTNSLGTLCPDIAAEWHPTKNENITPDQVAVAGSSIRDFWWRCTRFPDHEWQRIY